MQLTPLMFLKPDPVQDRLQRRICKLAAAHPRSRALFKNIFMLLEETEFFMSDDFIASVEDRLQKKFVRHRADERKHYKMLSKHLKDRGQHYDELSQVWEHRYLDYAENGWIPSQERLRSGKTAVNREMLMRTFAMTRILEFRGARVVAQFAEHCRGVDDDFCELAEEVLRDEQDHVGYITDELFQLAEGGLEDYAVYLMWASSETNRRWQGIGYAPILRLFLDDPEFTQGAERALYERAYRFASQAQSPHIPVMSADEFASSPWKWKMQRSLLRLPDLLWGGPVDATGTPAGEVSISLLVNAHADRVFEALCDVDRWHLWHGASWNASLPRHRSLEEGITVVIRLNGGDYLEETVTELDAKRRHVVLEATDAPFPLASYVNEVQVSERGSESELSFRLRYRLRDSVLPKTVARLGFQRALEQGLRGDLLRFKALLENVLSVGQVFAAPATAHKPQEAALS